MSRNGSEISSPLDTSREATLMSAQLSMFDLTTCGPIVSVTSSPASGDGATPYGSPDGTTLDLFGQEVVPANRSPRLEKTPVARTSGTYGRIGSISSASADLGSFLARMLLRRLDGAGSTLFSEIWRRKVTQRGRQYWEHTASARRTSGSACGSWGTPHGETYGGTAESELERKRQAVANGSSLGIAVTILEHQAQLASWPTPTHRDDRCDYHPDDYPRNGQGHPLTRQAFGVIAIGSPVATAMRGQLNPAFSRWLIGLPSCWDRAAPSKANQGSAC